MLSVFIFAFLVIVLSVFLWYGWKKQKFGEYYGICWIGSGLIVVAMVFHILQRERYQNFKIMVASDIIIIIACVMAGIIGYKQNKAA